MREREHIIEGRALVGARAGAAHQVDYVGAEDRRHGGELQDSGIGHVV
jgi:hypothetical protein